MKFTRRHFLKASAAGFGVAVLSFGLAGCSLGSSSDEEHLEISFDHGVASGDPLADSLIIWTRVTPLQADIDQVEVIWEVSQDANFDMLVHNGIATIGADSDFTLKVDLQGLDAGTTYYYRFKSNGKTSPVGMGKTLPTGNIDSVKFAVMSCANYPAGYFHVYGEAAKQDDLDAVLHLGDYIYEYSNTGYATGDAEALGRLLPEDNAGELLSLDDYRKRYATYRTDSQLQSLHTKVPFITVWDDHEIANDTWREGAQNHNEGEGDFSARKLAALQAYFEWMPIRNTANREQIYRQFDFGNLVSLYMLDTRVVARDKQLSYGDFDLTSQGGQADFMVSISDSSRTLIGQEQLTWVTDSMIQSDATWQVLGQQVLMTKMWLPAEIMMLLGTLEATLQQGGDPSALLGQANVLFAELATIKGRILMGDPTVTAQERARVETQLPYNLDAWDGYAYEREMLLGTAAAAGKNLVVLAGDTHNGWAGNLITDASNPLAPNAHAGVEFATSSVSSPGMEEYLMLDVTNLQALGQTEQVIKLLVDHLAYTNLANRGYLTVTFTAQKTDAQWHYVDTIKATDYNVAEARNHHMIVGEGLNKLIYQL